MPTEFAITSGNNGGPVDVVTSEGRNRLAVDANIVVSDDAEGAPFKKLSFCSTLKNLNKGSINKL